jgi:hypothetical protein
MAAIGRVNGIAATRRALLSNRFKIESTTLLRN